MRVPLGRLRLAVAKQTPDNREAGSGSYANACRCVSKVVDPDILQLRQSANPSPRLRDVEAGDRRSDRE